MLNSHSSPYDYQYQYKNTDHPPPPYTHTTNPFTQYNNVYSSNTLQNVLKGLYVLKEPQAMMQVGLMVCKYFQCSLFRQHNRSTYFALELSSSGHSHVCLLFTHKKQKRLANDVMYTSATHAGLAHDTTDCQTHYGSPHGCIFTTFYFKKIYIKIRPQIN